MEKPDAPHQRRLPPGPHGLPPELVERNQRERLIAAMAEVSAERGYGEASVAEVAKHAGVSTATFYRQFKDKGECMLVSFEALFGRLIEALEEGCGQWRDLESRAGGGARFVGAVLAEDVPAARLLSIEVLSVGPDGVRAQHEAIERLAALLRGPDSAAALDAAWVSVAAMTSLVGRRLAEGRLPDPDELGVLAEASVT